MIENGIIKVDNIYGVDFKVDLIPKENRSSRPGLEMVPTTITVHETDNENEGADARSHTVYVDNTREYVSWGFTVDDSIIIQELPIFENAWHAGDGPKGPGNRTSLSIEICVNRDGNYEVARANAVKLIVFLLKHIKTLKGVVPHQKWTGKNCPRKILKRGWDKFEAEIEAAKKVLEPAKYPVPDWALESFSWAVENNLNDGIVQDPAELQFTKMLYDYHQAMKKGLID